jgi:hypothetical protein
MGVGDKRQAFTAMGIQPQAGLREQDTAFDELVGD